MATDTDFRIDFLIVGAQKGGTTALARFLDPHPRICIAPAKEVHFFDDPALSNLDWESGGGVSGHDQMVYQVTSVAIFCEGVPEENADQLTILLAELDEARTFETYAGYVHYRDVLDDLASICLKSQKILAQSGSFGVVPEQAWLENDPEIESWWNPVKVLEQVLIPVLAILGDRDVNGDPIQGVYA